MNNFFFTNFSKSYFLFLIIYFSYTLPAFSEPGVSVFMYHRFGEDKYPSTNVSEEQFNSHIEYILSNKIKVLELEELIMIGVWKILVIQKNALKCTRMLVMTVLKSAWVDTTRWDVAHQDTTPISLLRNAWGQRCRNDHPWR